MLLQRKHLKILIIVTIIGLDNVMCVCEWCRCLCFGRQDLYRYSFVGEKSLTSLLQLTFCSYSGSLQKQKHYIVFNKANLGNKNGTPWSDCHLFDACWLLRTLNGLLGISIQKIKSFSFTKICSTTTLNVIKPHRNSHVAPFIKKYHN